MYRFNEHTYNRTKFTMNRPFHYQMIKEAIDNLRGIVTYPEIKEYINRGWPDENSNSLTADINAFTVNRISRINYTMNHKPRMTNTNSPYDLLFTTGRGQVEKYNCDKHGIWQIYIDKNGKPRAKQYIIPTN
jgi:hypothetical protein